MVNENENGASEGNEHSHSQHEQQSGGASEVSDKNVEPTNNYKKNRKRERDERRKQEEDEKTEIFERILNAKIVNNKKPKLENFDFHELAEHLTNSITDQLYRKYFPPIQNLYDKNVKDGKDVDFKNDLFVGEIVDDIKDEINADVSDRVVTSLRARVRKELDEQYHPDANSREEKRDKIIKNTRLITIPAFMVVAMVLFALTTLVTLEAFSIVTKTINMIVGIFNPAYISCESGVNDAETLLKFVCKPDLNSIIASILSVLDLLLIASLVVMVTIGGYENTVGRLGMTHDVPTWFGRLGINDLKLKVAASIVIISSIHLLTFFMLLDVEQGIVRNGASKVADHFSQEHVIVGSGHNDFRDTILLATGDDPESQTVGDHSNVSVDANVRFAAAYSSDALMWTAIVHIVFVVSALALSYMVKIQPSGNKVYDSDAAEARKERREIKRIEDLIKIGEDNKWSKDEIVKLIEAANRKL